MMQVIVNCSIVRNTIGACSRVSFIKNSSSNPYIFSHLQGARSVHTVRQQWIETGETFLGSGLFRKTVRGNGAGSPALTYFIQSRHESTVTKIPPLSSDVFSRTTGTAGGQGHQISDASPSQTVGSSAGVGESTSSNGSATDASIVASKTDANVFTSNVADSQSSTLAWESIPEPPAVPQSVEHLSNMVLNAAGEPTFASLGLGGWTPSGIVQQCLEFVHSTGAPWWASILIGTLCVRLLVFPLVIKSQRNAAKMHNSMPEMQSIQLKMTEARQTGNAMMAAKYGQDMMVFMKEKDISPFKSVLVPIAMAPIFISFFFGLRKMANLPVESMKEGGLWWFTDLTMADPYCLLPLLTSVTLWITMEVGVDGVQLNASNHGQLMRYAMRAIPVIMFPFTMNFPAAILCYWASTNAISLVQVSILKLPAVRSKLKIEPMRKIAPSTLPVKKKGFVDSFKDSWTNVKITKEMEDRGRYDEISFKRAGKGPIPKTYKYDPTKVVPGKESLAPPMQAKQKR